MDFFKVLNSIHVFVEGIKDISNDAVKAFSESFDEWTEKEKNRIAEMVKMGWYPNWATFSFLPEEAAHQTYDEFMMQRIDENIDDIVKEIVHFCENRKDILENAFELYKAENYTACIPLFIIQADGICNENENLSYFFTTRTATKGEKKAPAKASENFDKEKYDFFSKTVLELFEMHTGKKAHELPLTANIDNEKKNELNRHGILHGNYLDYGTKINAYKAFSFLAFIVFSAKDLLQKNLDGQNTDEGKAMNTNQRSDA